MFHIVLFAMWMATMGQTAVFRHNKNVFFPPDPGVIN